MTWNRYAYTENNPLRYSDPSGHYLDDSGPGIDPNKPQPVYPKLTQAGKEMLKLYHEYQQVDNWWNADGDFTIEEFLGLWILFESMFNSEQADWIATAIAQNLYVGGWNDPTGGSTIAVLNFMGSWVDGKSALRQGPNSLANQRYPKYHPALSDPQDFIREKGTYALHPTQLDFDRDKAPSSWGNVKGAQDMLKTIKEDHISFGPAENSAYFINDNFVVLSVEQSNYWASRVDSSFVP